jgi:hypothetical protein
VLEYVFFKIAPICLVDQRTALAARRSPRKAEKSIVYVLNLTVPPSQVDNCLEPSKSSAHLRVSHRRSFSLKLPLAKEAIYTTGTEQ